MNQPHKNKRKGFTLLEVLLVIAAIGILAAIVLVAINPTRQIAQVRNAQRRSDINTIYKALEQYLIDNKDYPEGITGTPKAICNNTVTPDCVDLEVLVPTYLAAIPKDPNGGLYEVYINPSNNRIAVEAPEVELGQSIAVNPIATTLPQGRTSCPTGYILVPGNSLYNTNNFCVMKYEAKAVSTSAPTVGLTTPEWETYNMIANDITATTSANGRAVASVASGYPIINISQTTAIDYCANQNTVSGGNLITNAEWMTIARNIEGQASNWTGSVVGIGSLYRGHTDQYPNFALEAGADNDGYIGTGESVWWDFHNDININVERRTHTLNNGEIIWDFSGNVIEWTSTTILGMDQPHSDPTGLTFRDFTAITNWGSLGPDAYRPSNNTWNSTQNVGTTYSDGTSTNNTLYAFIRGGGWVYSSPYAPSIAGVFAVYLDQPPTSTTSGAGFRCVLR